MKKIFIFFVLFIINWGLPLVLTAQESKGAMRLEVPANLDVQRYHLVPLQKSGFLIFYESNEVNNEGKRKWFFGMFDTHMQQKWLKFLPLKNKLLFVTRKQRGNTLVLAFQNSGKINSDYGFYEIVTFDIKNEKFAHIAGTMPLKAHIKTLDFHNKTSCLGINIGHNKADILFVNLDNGNVNPYHIGNGTQGRVESVSYNRYTGKFDVFAKLFNGKTYDKDILLQFSLQGDKKNEISIKNNNALRIPANYSEAVKSDSLFLYFGTYNLITGTTFKLSDYNGADKPGTAGFFVLTLNGNKQTGFRFYDFLSFKNIPGTFANRTYQVKKEGKGNTAKPMASLLYTGKPELIKHNDKYILSAEAYKPSYRTETRMDYDFYGRPYPYTYEVFDGYEIYDLILAGFTKNGEYIWDNDFPISGVHTYTLKRRTMVHPEEEYLIAAYADAGTIYAQLFDGPTDIGGVEKIRIAPKFIRDKVIDSDNEHIVYWYDNCYLVFGYQKLTNRTLKDQNYRTVFYVNKVVFQ